MNSFKYGGYCPHTPPKCFLGLFLLVLASRHAQRKTGNYPCKVQLIVPKALANEICRQTIKCHSRSGLKAPAEPSCRPKKFIFQYHHLWRFFKNKYYLKSSHRLKAISGRLIIINSYNLILIAISLRLIKMSINRPGCGL